MEKRRIREIMEASRVLRGAIRDKKKEIADLVVILQALQNGCDHPGLGRWPGKCGICDREVPHPGVSE